MQEYLKLFIDNEYPEFIDKYLNTKSLTRLKYVSQFCGCDYSKLYNPLFFFSRFDHSLVVAHMTWHFTKSKEETIAALLHDIGTPCFAHTIDYVFGDYLKQESSEKDIVDLIKKDDELLSYLKQDNINIENLKDLSKYPILENKSPRLCADRLDGVLHTCYIWLHTHSLKDIKEVFDNIVILKNEDGIKELGFKDKDICEKFVLMTEIYAKKLQACETKYIMKYISEIVKKAFNNSLFTLDDLYSKKEEEIINILNKNFESWKIFNNTEKIVRSDKEPSQFHANVETKKRNVIPLVKINNNFLRINEVSLQSEQIYLDLKNYKDTKYAYIEAIKNI